MCATDQNTIIYLDNGATSFPKPPAVAERMYHYVCNVGATINRSVYASAQSAGMVTYSLRERLARFFHFDQPNHVVLTAGNTMSLNMVLKGYLHSGDHCLVSSMEHNAVMRPLVQLQEQGVSFDRIPCNREGLLDPNDIPALLRPNTKLVVVAHGSNVGGGVQDIEAIGAICASRGIPFVVDAAQTAGHYPIDFGKAQLSALTVPGHKGLMGPSGIGALLLRPDFAQKLTPLITGGTGSASDTEVQPDYMPDRFESGTSNLPGIYGFEAAMAFLEEVGIDALRAHDQALTARFMAGLQEIPGIRLVGPRELAHRVGVISVDFTQQDNAECSYLLETTYHIMTRCGMHCAPSAHKTLDTFPQGVVRFSLGWYNTAEDVDAALEAIRALAQS